MPLENYYVLSYQEPHAEPSYFLVRKNGDKTGMPTSDLGELLKAAERNDISRGQIIVEVPEDVLKRTREKYKPEANVKPINPKLLEEL